MPKTYAMMILAAAVMLSATACSEKKEATPAEKYGKDIQSVRKMIFRDGTVTRALAEYRMTTGALPTNDQGLKVLLKCPKEADAKTWHGLDSAADYTDMWGNELHYRYPSKTHPDDVKQYDLWSLGPDGTDGTDDDILNHQYR